MADLYNTYTDRVRYTLQHDEYGSLIVTEPIGWKDDEKEYSRNADYHGIVAKFSNALSFIGDGAEFIQSIKDLYGINADIRLTKDERHPETDIWTRVYSGYLDLSTWEKEDNKVSIKFNSGGIETVLKSRQNEKVEINKTESLESTILDELTTEELVIQGRRIFLKTTSATDSNYNEAKVQVATNSGATRHGTVGIPLQLINNSHQDLAHSVIVNSLGNEVHPDPGMLFFAINDQPRSLDINLKFAADIFFQQYENVQWCRYKVCLTVYENGTDYDVKERRVLYELRSENPIESTDGRPSDLVLPGDYDLALPQFTIPINMPNYRTVIELLEGECLAFELLLSSDMFTDINAGVRAFAQNIDAELTIEENSYFKPTTTKFIFAHELGDRLIEIITGKKAFYSEFLGRTDLGYDVDGHGALTGNTHGFWVRGFDNLENDEDNLFKPLTTTWKDFFETYSSVWNIGLGIETFGLTERVRLEELKYFYNRNVTIRLPNKVKKVKRSTATDYYYSALVLGYEKGGEYEEALGLDEYNGQTNYTTCITRLNNQYSKLSPYRADGYGFEFARRKNVETNSTEDTSYDKDIFLMDLKRNGDEYLQRLWQDDFEIEPTGIFSPETATNLRFSPLNCLLRHGWVINSGLEKYQDRYIIYGSSTANSSLSTKLSGGSLYKENENIINNDLEKNRYIPEWIEFEHELDFEIMQMVEGTSTILGKTIPNFYGLVQFINENNELEYGFLFNLKPNGVGQWKVLKFYR